MLAEFTDQPFLISQAPGSHPFGNPQPGWQPVVDVRQWMHDYLTKPSEFNGGQTIHWMEDSHGKYGVSIETFGPYKLPGKLHEYGIPDGSFNAPTAAYCPQGDSCNKSLRLDANAAWRAAIGCPGTGIVNCGYDFVFYVSAGHDESSTWQEFGEMLYEDRNDIPAAFGPPRDAQGNPPLNQLGNPMPNWADTRYVDWTSWRAAANHWPNASTNPPRSSTQAESSGQSTYEHEFSHILGLPDNYNNPFADNERNFTGYWEMMSRGTFNGPGGTHNRWQIPNHGGSGLGPHHMLHFKNQLGILAPPDQLTLERDTLQDQGVAVVRIKARSDVPAGDALSGLTVNFGAGGDLAGTCANQGYTDVFYCPNRVGGSYLHYRVEVVDRVGNDSFAPGHGVLISKSRNTSTPRVWLIDPNPEDIGMIDFYRPDGTPVPVVRGDPRQLNDATFHAGTRSGSEYEYRDTFNRLHFYVLAKRRDAGGVLSYDVGVRRFDGAGPFTRGVAVGRAGTIGRRPGFLATCTFPLTNTGAAGTGVFDSDIYRLRASSSSTDWKVTLPNALAAAGRPDRRRAGARAPDAARRRSDGRHADRHVGDRRDQDGLPHVRRARSRHDATGLGRATRSEGGINAALALALILVAFACGGGTDGTPGGAADLPGTVPAGVTYAQPPDGALTAPAFSGKLLDGTPIDADDLWSKRPLLLVFTASWCGRCAEVHRDAAAVADEYDDAVALLGVVAENDSEPAIEYADKLDLGRPIGRLRARLARLRRARAAGRRPRLAWREGAERLAGGRLAGGLAPPAGQARDRAVSGFAVALAATVVACGCSGSDDGTSIRLVVPDKNIRAEGVECAGARPFQRTSAGAVLDRGGRRLGRRGGHAPGRPRRERRARDRLGGRANPDVLRAGLRRRPPAAAALPAPARARAPDRVHHR